MNPAIWAQAHGAAVHFPLALAVGSVALDTAAFALGTRSLARDLHAAGRWTMIGGALGSVPAVVSGLFVTRGSLLGHGALRMHHIFVWPAFALVVAVATWRAGNGPGPARRAFVAYLIAAGVAAGLLTAAGYWGGELMIAR